MGGTLARATNAAPPRGESARPIVAVRDLVKRFRRADGTVVNAVDGVSFDVARGEFVVLLGPSGCGKTTLLRCLAGLEQPAGGEIDIRGETVYSSVQGLETPPERRGLSMIFQSYALWPHMTAFENVAYPLRHGRGSKVGKAEIEERVRRTFELVGIPELLRQYPGRMSGGQQQRVALARALVGGSDLVLFDEPLSNVDAKVREALRLELLSMQRELGFAAVYVTHDQAEAMELAHRIAVMREGRIEQLGTAREVYSEPGSRYVANFIGTSNELHGSLEIASAGETVAQTPLGVVHARRGAAVDAGDEVVLVSRPERWRISREVPDGQTNFWQGEVDASLFLGSHVQHVVRLRDQLVVVWSRELDEYPQGADVWVAIDPSDVLVLPVDS
jgi:iron(III) transport system ATP-binding protein